MQQFLYRIQPTRIGMLADGPSAREAERTSITDERTVGIVVFLAESEVDAHRIVQGDPAVRQDVMRAELFPYRVALWSNRGPGGGTAAAKTSTGPST